MNKILLSTAVALSLMISVVDAEVTKGYNIKVPKQIMTPDSVDSRIGKLSFYDGVPTADTVKKLYDNLD